MSEWEAYNTLDPIGTWRDDYRMAVLDSLLVNIVNKLYTEKGHKPVVTTPLDFMPKWNEEEREVVQQSVEEMKQIMMAVAGAQNKKVGSQPKRTNDSKRKR